MFPAILIVTLPPGARVELVQLIFDMADDLLINSVSENVPLPFKNVNFNLSKAETCIT